MAARRRPSTSITAKEPPNLARRTSSRSLPPYMPKNMKSCHGGSFSRQRPHGMHGASSRAEGSPQYGQKPAVLRRSSRRQSGQTKSRSTPSTSGRRPENAGSSLSNGSRHTTHRRSRRPVARSSLSAPRIHAAMFLSDDTDHDSFRPSRARANARILSCAPAFHARSCGPSSPYRHSGSAHARPSASAM